MVQKKIKYPTFDKIFDSLPAEKRTAFAFQGLAALRGIAEKLGGEKVSENQQVAGDSQGNQALARYGLSPTNPEHLRVYLDIYEYLGEKATPDLAAKRAARYLSDSAKVSEWQRAGYEPSPLELWAESNEEKYVETHDSAWPEDSGMDKISKYMRDACR